MTIHLAPEEFIGVDHLRRYIDYHAKQEREAKTEQQRAYHQECLAWYQQQLAYERAEQEG